MKIKISIVTFLLITTTIFGQTNKAIDSLKQVLFDAKTHDTTKISTYISLCNKFKFLNIDTLGYYNKKVLELSKDNNDYKISEIYYHSGTFQYLKSNVDSARFYYDKALQILELIKNNELKVGIYSDYSLSYENSNNFSKELEYSLKAINLANNKDNNIHLARLYLNHSIIYDDVGFREQSKKYLKLAYSLSKNNNDYHTEVSSVRQLADYYIDEKKLDSAKIYLDRGLEICEILNSPIAHFEINIYLGKYYDELKMFTKAEKALLKAKKNAKKYNSKFFIMLCDAFLGEHELKRKNYKKASYYFDEFQKLFILNKKEQIGFLFYKNWAETEAKLGNNKKSNILFQQYLVFQDSIQSKKNMAILSEADTKYQTEKKDKELLQQKIKLQQQQTQYNYMTGLAIFLLIGSILAWFLFQQRQKRKNQEIVTLKREHQIQTLETLIEGEEKERFRIAKELHDGVNGDLSAIKFKLSSLLEMNNKVIKEAVTMIDDSCKQVRAISHNLVPPSLEKFNLLEATQEYCHNMDEVHTTKINFQHIGESLAITKKAQINIYRIVQELITNSIKHAEASEINVQMSCRNKTLQITVEDNGKGFEIDKVKSDGIGLSNIQSRIDYLNASIDVLSNEKGTSTTIEIDTKKIDEN